MAEVYDQDAERAPGHTERGLEILRSIARTRSILVGHSDVAAWEAEMADSPALAAIRYMQGEPR